MPMRPLSLALPFALALAVPALGCSGSVSSEPVPVTAETATTRAPVAQSTHGPLKVIADSLGDVPLTASQRAAVERLATDTEARHADSRAARKDLILAVAAQVQAGQIDRGALQPKVDALVAALAKAQPADRAAFEQLHALLTPDQRTAFVDALEARIGERISQVHDKHPLKQWAVDLGLSEEQKAQIKDAMKQRWQATAAAHQDAPPWAEAKQQGAKLMAAFKQERFVMDEVAPPKDLGAKAQKMCDRFLGMAEVALPVLTPQQRAIAAQKLRDRAEAMDDLAGMP
jgi:Spy/CpxP family protein refolding chaperone